MKTWNNPVRSRLANDEKAWTNFTDSYTEYVLPIQSEMSWKFPEKKNYYWGAKTHLKYQ